jgi:FMN phosphatase YigB (HAD superfamily)
MKVFIDFDDVIFNAKRFKNDLIKVFLENGITRSEFDNSYYTFAKKDQDRGKYYDPKSQIQVLRRRRQINHKKLNLKIDDLMGNLERYVFPDVAYFLGNFSKKDLFLITYGHVRFQKNKIKGSGIGKYFRKTIVSKKNKIDDILKIAGKIKLFPEEDIILIDDRPEQIEEVEKRKKKVTTFRMCRKEGRYSDLICLKRDYEVRNLREALKIIKKKKIK